MLGQLRSHFHQLRKLELMHELGSHPSCRCQWNVPTRPALLIGVGFRVVAALKQKLDSGSGLNTTHNMLYNNTMCVGIGCP
jgi:hypothetical protein